MKRLIELLLRIFSKSEPQQEVTEIVEQEQEQEKEEKMIVGYKGLKLIKQYEGLRLKAYKCPAGVWTIGYGHTKGVKEGDVITERDADRLLSEDLTPVEQYLNANMAGLNQNQFDALASFCFNLGINNFVRSTLKKKIEAHASKSEITGEFLKWVNANGKVMAGLLKRRTAEANLYFEGL